MLERVKPEQNFEYDLELWRRGQQERGRRVCPYQSVEGRNSMLNFRNVSGGAVVDRGSDEGWADETGKGGRFSFWTLTAM